MEDKIKWNINCKSGYFFIIIAGVTRTLMTGIHLHRITIYFKTWRLIKQSWRPAAIFQLEDKYNGRKIILIEVR